MKMSAVRINLSDIGDVSLEDLMHLEEPFTVHLDPLHLTDIVSEFDGAIAELIRTGDFVQLISCEVR